MKKPVIYFINISFLLMFYTHCIDLAHAEVSLDEAKKLEGELTPVGAERKGNRNGSIPPWTGGITKPPEGYKEGEFPISPFDEGKPLFTITAKNYQLYKNNLSKGQIALFQNYPDTFKMHVYKTYRTASYPNWVYADIKRNALKAELVDGGNGFRYGITSSPFPIPKNGVEIIWNHIGRFRCTKMVRFNSNAIVNADGTYTFIEFLEKNYMIYSFPDLTPEQKEKKTILAYFKQKVISPARWAGTFLLVHESTNEVKKSRISWVYNNTGARRLVRTPSVEYDAPGTLAFGLRTTDEWDAFNGSPDRYKWTLIGKTEMFIPYNCYHLSSGALKKEDIIRPGHINPDLVRYERHRVWIITADLKPNNRHIYKKRTFYIDEDSWQIALVDTYNNQDELWRTTQVYPINYYNVPVFFVTLITYNDLLHNRYLIMGLDNERTPPNFSADLSPNEFSPNFIRREAVR